MDGFRILAATIVIGATTQAPVNGQDSFEAFIIARGEAIDHVSYVTLTVTDRSRPVIVSQSGTDITVVGEDGAAIRVIGKARLPEDAWIWDMTSGTKESPSAIVAIGSETVTMSPMVSRAAEFAPATTIARAGNYFRGRRTGASARRPFALSGRARPALLVPSLDRVDLLEEVDGEWRRRALPVAGASEQTLGWGLGYRMRTRLLLPPFFEADIDGDGDGELLWRSADRFESVEPDAKKIDVKSWGPSPRIEATRILGFDHDVGLLVEDADGDGKVDLLATETGSGTVFFYSGEGRAGGSERAPDQVLKSSGWVLWRWFLDADGDGKKDLALLVVPELGLLEQVQVFRRSLLPVKLFVHRQESGGRFSRSPAFERRFDLPTAVAVTRNRREVQFTRPFLPVLIGNGKHGFVAPGDDGAADLWHFVDDEIERIGGTGITFGKGTHLPQPFTPATFDMNGDGRTDPLLLERGGDGDRATLWISRSR